MTRADAALAWGAWLAWTALSLHAAGSVGEDADAVVAFTMMFSAVLGLTIVMLVTATWDSDAYDDEEDGGR